MKEEQHIEATPGVCGGKPRIAGHRIRVQDIVVLHEYRGLSPDEIVATYPSLNLAQVYAALSYYFDHRQKIADDLARDRQLAVEVALENPSLVQARLRRAGVG